MKKIFITLGVIFLLLLFFVGSASGEDVILDEKVEIPPREFVSYPIQVNTNTTVDIIIDSDEKVNVYTMEETEFTENYQEGKEFENISEGTSENITNVELSVNLRPGRYHLTIENDNFTYSRDVSITVLKENETPGFTMVTLIVAILIVIFYNKSRRL